MGVQKVAMVQTDLFEHEKVGGDFINPCCFGKDFATWLRQRISDLPGFLISDPIQEDYGWGLEVRKNGESIWVAVSYVGTGPTKEPGKWVISTSSGGIIRRLFTRQESNARAVLVERIHNLLETTPGITMLRDYYRIAT
jgi:hypothetical protein